MIGTLDSGLNPGRPGKRGSQKGVCEQGTRKLTALPKFTFYFLEIYH